MKKALSEDWASLTSLDPSPVTVGASPVSEGIPFNWSPYFYGLHHRKSGEPDSDGRTGRQLNVASFLVFDKTADAGSGGSRPGVFPEGRKPAMIPLRMAVSIKRNADTASTAASRPVPEVGGPPVFAAPAVTGRNMVNEAARRF